MMQSDNIADLAAALAKAQGEIAAAAKDSLNPHFKSKYADLASVWNACRAPLSKHGLAVIQTTEPTDNGRVRVITTLAHASGQWVRGTLDVAPTQATPQGMGSALTYCRRYALAAMVGVAPDDDDDGNAASQRNGNGATPVPIRPATISEDQKRELVDLMRQAKVSDTRKFLDYLRVASLDDLSAEKFADAKAALVRKLEKGAA